MGKIEFITRIQVNGVKEEVSGAKASEIIRERVENALQALNYEQRAAGQGRQGGTSMKDLIDSILIGGMATYLPIWTWDGRIDQIAGAVTLIVLVYIAKRWHVWNV